MRFRFLGPNAGLASLTLAATLTTMVACDKMPWAKKGDAGDDAATAVGTDAAPTAEATTPPPADTTAPLDTTVPPAVPVPNTPVVVVKKDGGVVVDAGAAKVDAAVPVPVPTPQPNKPPVPTALPSGLKLPPNFPTGLPTSWPPKK